MLVAQSRLRNPDRFESALTLALTATLVACWAAHIVACVVGGFWEFLVVGLLVLPVALLHGLMVIATAWL